MKNGVLILTTPINSTCVWQLICNSSLRSQSCIISMGKLSNETNPISKLWIDWETLLQRIKWKYSWGRFQVPALDFYIHVYKVFIHWKQRHILATWNTHMQKTHKKKRINIANLYSWFALFFFNICRTQYSLNWCDYMWG